MIRSLARVYLAMGVLITASMAVAQDFSADVINGKGGGIKKVYSTKNKVRFEFEGQNQAMGPIAAIVDETQNTWVMLLSGKQMYIDGWPQMMQKPIITQYWHVEDVNDACPQWKKLFEQSGTSKNWGSCTRIGTDTVGGRSTVKYEGVSSKGEKNNIWVDTKLHCVIKMDGGGGIELTNIREGAQPASVFEVPAGYSKFDMGAMMQRQH